MSTTELPEDGRLPNPNLSPEKEKAPDKNKGAGREGGIITVITGFIFT
jgi:hypothetical protein